MDLPDPMQFSVEVDREEDGRWIAEISSLPGVLAYGSSEQEALAAAEALALRVIADQLENGEFDPKRVGSVSSPLEPLAERQGNPRARVAPSNRLEHQAGGVLAQDALEARMEGLCFCLP